MNNSKVMFIFVVSDIGGAPILSVPEVSSDRINVLCSMTSVIDCLTSTIYGEGVSIGSIDVGNRRLLHMKRENLVFLLLVPKDIDADVAFRMLRELAEKFIELFGEDLDEARGITLFNAEAVESFKKEVMGVLMDVVQEFAPGHLDVFLEELFALLKSRGADVSEVQAKFIPANVPFIVEGRDISKVKDDLDSKILSTCDGRKTVQEIAEELNVPASEVYKRLAKLGKKGYVRWKIVYRLVG